MTKKKSKKKGEEIDEEVENLKRALATQCDDDELVTLNAPVFVPPPSKKGDVVAIFIPHKKKKSRNKT